MNGCRLQTNKEDSSLKRTTDRNHDGEITSSERKGRASREHPFSQSKVNHGKGNVGAQLMASGPSGSRRKLKNPPRCTTAARLGGRPRFNIVDTAKTLSHLAMAAMVDIEELIDIDDVYASCKEPRLKRHSRRAVAMTERGKQSLEVTELKEITTVVDSGREHSSLAVIAGRRQCGLVRAPTLPPHYGRRRLLEIRFVHKSLPICMN
ncbi:hypothetical protein PCH_Pc13g14610 [Penicillium rubens Wisconsin 54-1255]|uniref:Uncharacterized protein n=1 Tax=Penicillium rubens (strain ATCC 28089 / DSM 1075 / NRRL 1951 / Wisconsin 54-1255) TaxID=500485 RepID=B6H2I3_PENRW|nr:hypothetical protein PCH_Pc13g14610 [Penicillium rubens Wisconsin 54-1255]